MSDAVRVVCIPCDAAIQAKVSELNLHNNYRLRMKDLNYAEKIKEVCTPL